MDGGDQRQKTNQWQRLAHPRRELLHFRSDHQWISRQRHRSGGRSQCANQLECHRPRGNGVYAVGASDLFFGLDIIGRQGLPQTSNAGPAVPNGATGVFLQDVHSAYFDGNTIASNGLDGIATSGDCTGIRMQDPTLPTVIYGNGLMVADIGFDGPTEQGRPVLTTADVSNGFLRVIGYANSVPNVPLLITIFSSDTAPDAKFPLYIKKVNTNAQGLATFE